MPSLDNEKAMEFGGGNYVNYTHTKVWKQNSLNLIIF